MNDDLISEVLTLLSTLKGFPVLPPPDGKAMGPVAMSYAALLAQMPDSTLKAFRSGLLLRYDERPSVKALAEWAAEIAQSKPALPDYLVPGTHRLTGPAPSPCGGSALAVITDAARQSRASGSPIPEEAKAVFRQLRDRVKQDNASTGAVIVPRAEAGDWGLEYVYQGGRTDKLPARWSEAAALEKAKEQRLKNPHVTVRVWCQSAVGSNLVTA